MNTSQRITEKVTTPVDPNSPVPDMHLHIWTGTGIDNLNGKAGVYPHIYFMIGDHRYEEGADLRWIVDESMDTQPTVKGAWQFRFPWIPEVKMRMLRKGPAELTNVQVTIGERTFDSGPMSLKDFASWFDRTIIPVMLETYEGD